MQFPVCDLEDVSCHCLLPLRLFDHLPSWYVEWRTSAISARCHRLPPAAPSSPIRLHLTPRGPCCRPELRPSQYLIRMGKEDLTLSELCAGPLPALFHASLLMSELPSTHTHLTPYTHFQIRHSFNTLSLPNRLSQRHLRHRKDTQSMPTFFLSFSLFTGCFVIRD